MVVGPPGSAGLAVQPCEINRSARCRYDRRSVNRRTGRKPALQKQSNAGLASGSAGILPAAAMRHRRYSELHPLQLILIETQ